jgi:hypothetical protein
MSKQQVSSMTVIQLKAALAKIGVDVDSSYRKADLVSLYMQHAFKQTHGTNEDDEDEDDEDEDEDTDEEKDVQSKSGSRKGVVKDRPRNIPSPVSYLLLHTHIDSYLDNSWTSVAMHSRNHKAVWNRMHKMWADQTLAWLDFASKEGEQIVNEDSPEYIQFQKQNRATRDRNIEDEDEDEDDDYDEGHDFVNQQRRLIANTKLPIDVTFGNRLENQVWGSIDMEQATCERNPNLFETGGLRQMLSIVKLPRMSEE